jgi:hypothetical protein
MFESSPYELNGLMHIFSNSPEGLTTDLHGDGERDANLHDVS